MESNAFLGEIENGVPMRFTPILATVPVLPGDLRARHGSAADGDSHEGLASGAVRGLRALPRDGEEAYPVKGGSRFQPLGQALSRGAVDTTNFPQDRPQKRLGLRVGGVLVGCLNFPPPGRLLQVWDVVYHVLRLTPLTARNQGGSAEASADRCAKPFGAVDDGRKPVLPAKAAVQELLEEGPTGPPRSPSPSGPILGRSCPLIR